MPLLLLMMMVLVMMMIEDCQDVGDDVGVCGRCPS